MKDKFLDQLKAFLGVLIMIDEETVWQETEPKWWLEMMVVQRQIRKSIKEIEK